MMKRKWGWVLAGLAVLMLAGCQPNNAKPGSSASGKARSSQSAVKKAPANKQKTESETKLWSAQKTKALSAFMHEWIKTSQRANWTWQATYDGEKPNHFGSVYPDDIQNGTYHTNLKWGYRDISFDWATTGAEKGEFLVVAAATATEPHDPNTWAFTVTWFFCLHNGQPTVLLTQTIEGGTVYVYDSQNAALQQGFAKIVTGKAPKTLSDDSLNAGAEVSGELLKDFPPAYRHVWYRYSTRIAADGSAIVPAEQFTDDLTHGDQFKILPPSETSPHWITVFGKTQTAGAGAHYYLRYRYYDGKQIPVLMNAYGANMKFDYNAFTDPETAKQMAGIAYGDEPKPRQ